jgi:hypothetical protein
MNVRDANRDFQPIASLSLHTSLAAVACPFFLQRLLLLGDAFTFLQSHLVFLLQAGARSEQGSNKQQQVMVLLAARCKPETARENYTITAKGKRNQGQEEWKKEIEKGKKVRRKERER